jgi:phosphoribosyl 1,2-cyclic phosphodiesterase
MISVQFRGVRGSIPTPSRSHQRFGGNTSCVQLHLPETEKKLILDAGTGIFELGNELMSTRGNDAIEGNIFITHAHSDHIQGIPFFKPLYSSGNYFGIHMPPQEDSSCEQILKNLMAPAFFPVSPDAFQAGIKYITRKTGPEIISENVMVESHNVNHPGNVYLYKIHAYGKIIVYCPDNELIESDSRMLNRYIRLFENADLLIHDSHESRLSYQNKAGWGHSAWELVCELAADAGVKQLCLTHHSPDNDDRSLEERSEQLLKYRRHFRGLRFAAEGDQVYV